jgi:two-component system sensor kinase FixL
MSDGRIGAQRPVDMTAAPHHARALGPDGELADFASESILVCAPDGTVLYWNRAAETLFGWPASALVGRKIDDISIAPKGQPHVQFLAHGGWNGRVVRRSPDGREIAASVRAFARRDAAGALVEIVEYAVLENHSLVELQASEDRLRRLIHHLPIALLYVDARIMGETLRQLEADGVTDIAAHLDAHPELVEFGKDVVLITGANREAVSLFGCEAPEALIRPVRFLFEASPSTAARVMSAHFRGRRSYTEEMKVRSLDGRLLDVLLLVTYPTPSEGLETTFLCMLDITDRLRTEAQLRQLQADFAHAARISTLGELATSIAHEVRQPLAAIITNGETSLRWLARDEPNFPKLKHLTGRIVASATRANEIIQRIQDMTRKRGSPREAVNLNEVVEEALLFVRHDTEEKALTLRLDLAPDLPMLIGDRVQLQQVVVNLALNGVQSIGQAGSGGGEIVLRTLRAPSGAVVLSIRDTGAGIAEESLEEIFSSFFTTKESGMGIGLTICQSIIAAHGGRIEAANHPEGGAIVTVSLPVEGEIG